MKIKHLLILLCLLLFSKTISAQGIGINSTGSPPHSSAILDVSSSTQGLLAPRMTTAQRLAIASPAAGLLLFDTDTDSYWHRNDSIWVNLLSERTAWSTSGNSGMPTSFIGTT